MPELRGKIPSQTLVAQRRLVLAKAGKDSDCRIFDINILLRARSDMASSIIASISSIFAALRASLREQRALDIFLLVKTSV